MSINHKIINFLFNKKNLIYLKNKRYIFLILVLILGLAVFIKIFNYNELFINKKIEMTITKNKNNISDLYDERIITYQNKYQINKIDFEHGLVLKHSALGLLGFDKNFFMDFSTRMTVKKDGRYKFVVYSDDGFNLKINDGLIMEFTKDRSFSKSEKEVDLKIGTYNLTVSYFQGYGQLGLKAYYLDSEQMYFIGESSRYLSFKL
jgi:hypothetical protein